MVNNTDIDTTNDFLKEEIRDDFFVDLKRKKIWKVQLELYEKLKEVCDKHDLKIFAFGGTLLGAIRHKGFIPWDDDLDVALCRDDFNKLCEIASKEFQEPFFFQTGLTDRNYFIGIARLRKTTTTGIITCFSDHIYNNGIFIDIYVYDKIPEDNKKLNILLFKLKFYYSFLSHYHNINALGIKRILLLPLISLVRVFITYESLYKKYLHLCMSYEKSETTRLGFLCMPVFMKYEATTTGVEYLIKVKYEYQSINVPSDYDNMLRKAYGDYHKFPPVSERGKWHENVIIYEPDLPFLEYYKLHSNRFAKVIKEYDNIR